MPQKLRSITIEYDNASPVYIGASDIEKMCKAEAALSEINRAVEVAKSLSRLGAQP